MTALTLALTLPLSLIVLTTLAIALICLRVFELSACVCQYRWVLTPTIIGCVGPIMRRSIDRSAWLGLRR
jgi:uncharacterized membrane protein YcfT